MSEQPTTDKVKKEIQKNRFAWLDNTAFYRILSIFIIVSIIVVVGFIIKATVDRFDAKRGPRSLAEKAIIDTEVAVRKNPKSAKKRIELSKAYASVGRYADAKKQLNIARQIDKTNPEIPFLMGAVYNKSGDFKNAINYLKKAASAKKQLGPFYSKTYFEMGQAYYDNNDYEKAIEAYEKVLDYDPLASDVMNEIGRAYEDLENRKEAISWYKDALVYDPDFEEARRSLIRLGVKEKDIPKPKEEF
ncbi:MAG: tetratricopeptide repeat protein [Actinobacteria bacterium]|nr:MAG: tetratricopeptide repeat protein [Actinomycetota bacterium]